MAMNPEPVRAVFFDVGGTLLKVRPSVGHVYAEAAAHLGHSISPERINQSFQEAWNRSLKRRRDADYLTTDAILREEWRIIVSESFDGALPQEAARLAFEDLYDHFSGPKPWSLVDGARETLAALKADGLRLGVLSNWDSRLPAILQSFGILEAFDFSVVSYQVGVEKPHRGMFDEARRRAGSSPQSLVVVGDSWEQDILPALDFGWRAIWIRPREAAERTDRVPTAERFSDVLQLVREGGRLRREA